MKYIKTFEDNTVNEKYKTGSYVICVNKVANNSEDLDKFLENNIGIIRSNNYTKPEFPYLIYFENLSSSLKTKYEELDYTNCIMFKKNEILYCSENKEDLETILQGKKFNL